MEEQVEYNELFSLVGGVYISKLGGKPLEILFSIKHKHCLWTFPQKNKSNEESLNKHSFKQSS